MLLTVRDVADIDEAMKAVVTAAAGAATWLSQATGNPLKLLFDAKFDLVGFHPFDGRALNIVEQINQTWSLVTALEAARLLFARHPEAGGYSLAPGAHAAQALDLMSIESGLVGAEIFAATSPDSNRKLSKDLARLDGRPEQFRYAIFMSPMHPRTERLPKLERLNGIEVWSVAAPEGFLQ